jgi:hypothetical protein
MTLPVFGFRAEAEAFLFLEGSPVAHRRSTSKLDPSGCIPQAPSLLRRRLCFRCEKGAATKPRSELPTVVSVQNLMLIKDRSHAWKPDYRKRKAPASKGGKAWDSSRGYWSGS